VSEEQRTREFRRRRGGDANSTLMLVITGARALLGVALIVLLAIAP
jgi:hypothetical protein